MKPKTSEEIVRLAGISCCFGSTALGRVDAGSTRQSRRLPGTITGKTGVRHLAGTVFTYPSA